MDFAGRAVLETTRVVIRADSATSSAAATTSGSAATAERPPIYKVVGIVLAITSGVFIGISFVLKKIDLLKSNDKYNEAAGEGYGYLKNAYWWGGMTLMIIGEICNFAAYMFVDAIMVTPLGALSVVITTILSAIFLKERLSFVGKVSCFLCIIGSVIIVLNAPEQSAVANIEQMQHYVIAPGFLVYAGLIIIGAAFTAFWAGPRYGKKSMLVYLSICSTIGGLSVVATQGLGSAIIAQIRGEAQFNKWFTYVLLVFVIATLLTEIIYLNKALNLFNAALVTPTYYVYFTSATIVTSAILFRGFHGTAVSITTVVMGFLVICAGVVLLQLAKSSKDVPDSAVFQGELDQVRTMAEQEEPESEPRADTIRGGAAIVRAMSKIRTKRQAEELHRMTEERMEPIGENETVEWDGLRRRKTTSTGSGSLVRRKTVHPPLGMSRFPDDVSEPDSEVHPGFFGRIGRKSVQSGSRSRRPGHSPVPLGEVNVGPNKTDSDLEAGREHVYGLPAGLRKLHDGHDEDTSYQGASGGQHLHWANDADNRERASSRGSSLAPPRPPPHVQGKSDGTAKRQFSFQNVFHRNRFSITEDNPSVRPVSRGALSFIGRAKDERTHVITEEERLGLVTGDSHKQVPKHDEAAEDGNGSDEWQVTSGTTSSPEVVGSGSESDGKRRRRDTYDDEDDDEFYDQPLRSPETYQGGGGHSALR
ncbi:hypothetical protein B0A48_15062 [Cryoendolithus antarcticus]|uniref:Magnesium transporter NIPA2 n=1 Tax=Cryoendolithus antarcticus TaxID=1507870 RepID=A0A1V8SJF9_9PEZI|nr:hypothetical protein B0A48_15062 [Cryoendolithus antarcticus]